MTLHVAKLSFDVSWYLHAQLLIELPLLLYLRYTRGKNKIRVWKHLVPEVSADDRLSVARILYSKSFNYRRHQLNKVKDLQLDFMVVASQTHSPS